MDFTEILSRKFCDADTFLDRALESPLENQVIGYISPVATILSEGVACICVLRLSLWRKTPEFGKTDFADDKLILIPSVSIYARWHPEGGCIWGTWISLNSGKMAKG